MFLTTDEDMSVAAELALEGLGTRHQGQLAPKDEDVRMDKEPEHHGADVERREHQGNQALRGLYRLPGTAARV